MDEVGEHTRWKDMATTTVRHFEDLFSTSQIGDDQALHNILEWQ